jgi:cytochrome c oxidase subunit 1
MAEVLTHKTQATASQPEELNFLNENRGIKSWLFTVDHKRIGLMYFWTIMLMFFIGGVLALVLRTELLTPQKTIVSASTYNQLFTLHGAIMTFMVLVPLVPATLGNFVLPIMLGAKDVAFPRLNLASYYIYVAGAIMAVAAIVGGGLETGWTFYTPYSSTTGGGVSVMTMAAFVLGFSSILTGLNFIATIHRLRAPGMAWYNLPLFVWGMWATSVIQVLATPVIGITMVLLLMERVFQVGIFDASLGGDPVLFQHFFWFYSHPVVYIMILPGMAIISEVIPTFSQKPIFGYKPIAWSSVGIAVVGFLVWGHHMFVSGQSEFAAAVFSFITFLVAIPSGVKVWNWMATMYRGSISLKAPMLFGIGGLTGLFLGTLATDVHLHDTYFVVAHFHYVMMGGTLIAFFAGVHYWWPKMYGRMYNEFWASIGCLLVFLGFNGTFLPQFILGSRGMPRRYYNYLDQFQFLHVSSTIGSYVLGLGLVIMAATLIAPLFRKRYDAPPNPWGAASLEWTVSSPAPTHNFHHDPVFTHGPYDYKAARAAEKAGSHA